MKMVVIALFAMLLSLQHSFISYEHTDHSHVHQQSKLANNAALPTQHHHTCTDTSELQPSTIASHSEAHNCCENSTDKFLDALDNADIECSPQCDQCSDDYSTSACLFVSLAEGPTFLLAFNLQEQSSSFYSLPTSNPYIPPIV